MGNRMIIENATNPVLVLVPRGVKTFTFSILGWASTKTACINRVAIREHALTKKESQTQSITCRIVAPK